MRGDASELDRAVAALQGFPERFRRDVLLLGARAAGNLLVRDLRAEAPNGPPKPKQSRSKKLRARIRLRIVQKGPTEVEAAAESRAPHTHLVELGTKPHETPLVRAKAFLLQGRFIRRQVLRHPGAKPNPFIDRVRRRDHANVINIYQAVLTNACAALAKEMGS